MKVHTAQKKSASAAHVKIRKHNDAAVSVFRSDFLQIRDIIVPAMVTDILYAARKDRITKTGVLKITSEEALSGLTTAYT